jgi:elongation factor G
VFKVMSDPYVGKLTYFRVYSGQVKAGRPRAQHDDGKTERDRPHPPDAREPPRGARRDRAGEIAGRGRPQGIHHGRHARSRHAPIRLESMEFPDPVISVAIEPKTKGDQDKLAPGPAALSGGGPDLPRAHDEETGQTLISGMGELHLEIIVDRCSASSTVDANVGPPQVAYRETFARTGREDRGALRPARPAAAASTATL